MTEQPIRQDRQASRGWRKLKIAVTGVLLLPVVAVLGLLIVWVTSLIDPAPQQDDCSFGAVSKADYQKLLRDAKAQGWTVWPGLSKGIFWPSEFLLDGPTERFEPELGEKLLRAVEQLQPRPASPEHTLAAAHAVMRSMGAEYVAVWSIPELRRGAETPATTVTFRYFMPQTRFAPLCFLCPLWPFTTIAMSFRRDATSGSHALERIVVLHSNLLYSPNKKERNITEACPRLPQ